MAEMEKVEFEFPDEAEEKKPKASKEVEVDEEEIEVEVVSDVPPEDRNRKPSDPPEDVTDEELENYSEKVKKRLQKFSKGYHDERRAKEAAQREREEALRLAKTLVEENKKLKGTVSKNQEALLEQAKKAVVAELEQAKRKYKEAYESGDSDAVVSAQEALTSAKLKAERVSNFKLPPLQDKETDVKPQSEQDKDSETEQVPVDSRAHEWAKENKWFGTDDEMTSFALGLHNKLVKQGVDPKSDEYYEKINSRMRQVFPEQFEETEAEDKPKRKSVVAPATRSTAPKKVRLTETQVALAKKLGVPLELYAKQVAEEMRKQNG
jgi:hypothetical protein